MLVIKTIGYEYELYIHPKTLYLTWKPIKVNDWYYWLIFTFKVFDVQKAIAKHKAQLEQHKEQIRQRKLKQTNNENN